MASDLKPTNSLNNPGQAAQSTEVNFKESKYFGSKIYIIFWVV